MFVCTCVLGGGGRGAGSHVYPDECYRRFLKSAKYVALTGDGSYYSGCRDMLNKTLDL